MNASTVLEVYTDTSSIQRVLREHSAKVGVEEAIVIIQNAPPHGPYQILRFNNKRIRGTPVIREPRDIIEILDSIFDASKRAPLLACCAAAVIKKVANTFRESVGNGFVVAEPSDFEQLFVTVRPEFPSRPLLFVPWSILPLLDDDELARDAVEFVWILWKNFTRCSDHPPNANTFLNEFFSCFYVVIMDSNDTVVKGQFFRLDDESFCSLFLKRWLDEHDCAVCMVCFPLIHVHVLQSNSHPAGQDKQLGKVHFCTTCFHALCHKCARQCALSCPVCVSGKLQLHRHFVGIGKHIAP